MDSISSSPFAVIAADSLFFSPFFPSNLQKRLPQKFPVLVRLAGALLAGPQFSIIFWTLTLFIRRDCAMPALGHATKGGAVPI